MYGNDHGYAHSRLENTVVCTKDGTPVLVCSVQPGMKCFCVYLENNKEVVLNIKDLDLTPVKLGYVNMVNGDSLYVVRKPMRRDWRQGMRRGNITVIGRAYNINNMRYKDMVATIKGHYPAYNVVVGLLVKEELRHSKAWCRDFSLLPSGQIEYRGASRVGHYNTKTKELVLKEEFTYLQEALMESIK